MDRLLLIRTVISIILSLSIAHLLKGLARLIQHPNREPFYWVHLLWVFYTFLLLLEYWWWEFRLEKVLEWNFLSYFFLIFYVTLFYMLCSLLFPEDLDDYDGFKDYYYSRRKWIFGLLAFIFVVDVGDTLLKGTAYLQSFGAEYPVRVVSHVVLFLLAARIRREWFHAALAIGAIVYSLLWIIRFYSGQ